MGSGKKTSGKKQRGKKKPAPVAGAHSARQSMTANGLDGKSGQMDDRVPEAMTVAWMLCLVACLVAELGAVLGFGGIVVAGSADQLPGMVAMIPTVLAFVAWITGTCCLGLTFIVLRVRATPPPGPIVRTAIVAGLLPWLGLAGLWLAQAAR